MALTGVPNDAMEISFITMAIIGFQNTGFPSYLKVGHSCFIWPGRLFGYSDIIFLLLIDLKN